MHLKKSVIGLQVRALKNCNKWTSVHKDYWRWKNVIFWINTHTQIEKQPNHNWNTPIHLKTNGSHIKVPLIFLFLIMTDVWKSYVFITNCELNGYVYILEIVLDIFCGCLTLNRMHIKLASLIICSINNNLTNTSSTPPPEIKKTVLYLVHLIVLCPSTVTSYLLEI